MRHMRFAALVVVLGLISASLGCGGTTFFFFSSGHSATFASISGTVSIVQLTTGTGGTVITAVTLLTGANAQTVNFCGNVVGQFPVNTFVTVHFNQATPCSTIVEVII